MASEIVTKPGRLNLRHWPDVPLDVTFTWTVTAAAPTGTVTAVFTARDGATVSLGIGTGITLGTGTVRVQLTGSQATGLLGYGDWVLLDDGVPTIAGDWHCSRDHGSATSSSVTVMTSASSVSVTSLTSSTALINHEADTTNVHGIADTSALYRSGGTDVAVADGGTGASTAAGARTNLVVDKAAHVVSEELLGTVTDLGALLETLAATYDYILVRAKATSYPMTTTATLDGVTIEFEPGATVSANIAAGYSFELSNATLINCSITSTYTGTPAAGTHELTSRGVSAGNNTVIHNLTAEYVGSGVTVTGANVLIDGVKVSNARHYKGWAAAVHLTGSSCHDVTIRRVNATDTDRGIEVEAGVYDVWVGDIKMTRVFPNGYAGQPGDYSTYTFVLDAHAHTGEGGPRNINYSNAVLTDCGGGVSFVRSDGSNDSDLPINCTADNIVIEGHALSTGYHSVEMMGHNNRASVVLRAGSAVNAKHCVSIENATACTVEVRQAAAYALPLVTGASTANGCTVVAQRISAPTTGTGYLFDIDSPSTMLDLDVRNVTGTTGYLRLDDSSHGSRTRRFRYDVASGETFAAVVLLNGVSDAWLHSIVGTNNETAVLDISTSGGVTRGGADGFISRSTAATSVSLGGASSYFDTSGLDTTLGRLSDSGASSRITRAGWADYLSSLGDNPVYSADVASRSIATPITWKVANEGVWVRLYARRRFVLNRFRFAVVTQSGNYYAAIMNAAGTVLWTTRTSVPAAGLVSLTLSTGIEVRAGQELYLALAVDNTTAAVCGVNVPGSTYQNLFARANNSVAAGKVTNMYTSNVQAGATITVGSTFPDFVPLLAVAQV